MTTVINDYLLSTQKTPLRKFRSGVFCCVSQHLNEKEITKHCVPFYTLASLPLSPRERPASYLYTAFYYTPCISSVKLFHHFLLHSFLHPECHLIVHPCAHRPAHHPVQFPAPRYHHVACQLASQPLPPAGTLRQFH